MREKVGMREREREKERENRVYKGIFDMHRGMT
jgi:hypothetical protein